jgi:hypothetical protein
LILIISGVLIVNLLGTNKWNHYLVIFIWY